MTFSILLVEVHLQATGDAPIMKQKKYKVDGEKRIDWIIAFIRKFLKLEPTDSLVSKTLFILKRLIKSLTVTQSEHHNTIMFSYTLVFIRQPSICPFTRSDCKKLMRMFWTQRKISAALRKKSSMGIIWPHRSIYFLYPCFNE